MYGEKCLLQASCKLSESNPFSFLNGKQLWMNILCKSCFCIRMLSLCNGKHQVSVRNKCQKICVNIHNSV